jgi:hypothetical protein
MKKSSVILLFLMISFLLSACSAGPEKAAKDWFTASNELDGNKMLDLTCRAMREDIQMAGMISSAIYMLPQLLGLNLPEGKVDVSDLTFSKIRGDDTYAHVRVTGEIRIAVLAFPMAYDINETWLMVFENGKWKWCGEAY